MTRSFRLGASFFISNSFHPDPFVCRPISPGKTRPYWPPPNPQHSRKMFPSLKHLWEFPSFLCFHSAVLQIRIPGWSPPPSSYTKGNKPTPPFDPTSQKVTFTTPPPKPGIRKNLVLWVVPNVPIIVDLAKPTLQGVTPYPTSPVSFFPKKNKPPTLNPTSKAPKPTCVTQTVKRSLYTSHNTQGPEYLNTSTKPIF